MSAVVGFEWASIPRRYNNVRIGSLVIHIEDASLSGGEQLHMLSKERGVLPREFDGVSQADSYVGYKLFAPGDIVMNKMQAWNGVFGLAKTHGIVSPDYAVFRPQQGRVDARWLVYLLKDNIYSGVFSGISRGMGTGFNRVHPESFLKVPVPLPPLEEQRRIADFLDAETARIDRVVSIRRRQLAVFEERAQAVLDHVLVQEDDPMVHLSRLSRVQSGVTVDGGRVTEDAELRPYLRVANVQADGLDLSEVKEILIAPASARRFELRPGDVLMTEGGDLDKLGRGTVWSGEIPGCLHQNHVFAVRPNSLLSGKYLALLTRTSLARSYFEMTGSKTTNLASTSSGKILGFRIPLLELDEQLRRTSEAEKELSQISAIATAMAKQVELLSERRQALITAAVTGEFDVSTASGRGIEE